jgi:hypothetical protein
MRSISAFVLCLAISFRICWNRRRRQRLPRDEGDGHVADHARRVDAHHGPDLVVQQIVQLNLTLDRLDAGVVGHADVVQNAPQDRRRGVLILLDDLAQGPPEERVRLGVDVPACQRVIVDRLE